MGAAAAFGPTAEHRRGEEPQEGQSFCGLLLTAAIAGTAGAARWRSNQHGAGLFASRARKAPAAARQGWNGKASGTRRRGQGGGGGPDPERSYFPS
jgi:hypothetical protein